MPGISEYKQVAIDSLIPYVNNAKQHTEGQITRIASSIREFGFLSPCVIDNQYNVIAGHGRILAAKKLGMANVPCVFVEGLTEAQRKAYMLADNRLSELAEWDMDIVASELEALRSMDFDIDLTGFDLDDAKGVVEDNYNPNPPESPVSKYGDIYQLGRHRIMCGDSTSAQDVATLMGGVKADLLLTDPPYNVNVNGKAGSILNDNQADELKDRAAKERRRVIRLLRNAGVAENRITALIPIIENTAWMYVKLEDARAAIRTAQIVISYDNGGGQRGIRENPLFRGYESLWKAYMLGMGRLLDCMPAEKAEEAKDGLDSDAPNTVLDIVMARRRKNA